MTARLQARAPPERKGSRRAQERQPRAGLTATCGAGPAASRPLSPSSCGNPGRCVPVPQLSRGRERLKDTECGSQRSPSCTEASRPPWFWELTVTVQRTSRGFEHLLSETRKAAGCVANCSQRALWGLDAGSSLLSTAPTSCRRMTQDASVQESKEDAGAMV